MSPSDESPDGQPGRLWRQPRSRWLLGIPLGGFLMLLAGAAGLGAFNAVIHATSTNEFCYVCHSHDAFVRPTYEASVHFSNPSGVRAQCADCHLPHGWFELVWTKAVVSLDIIPELAGKISTEEKYLSHQPEMAEQVREQFRADDSRFCRHCHTFDAMQAQSETARKMHDMASSGGGQTCIDCHRGTGHQRSATAGSRQRGETRS